MTIFEPTPRFTAKERRLIELLSKLLKDHLSNKVNLSNVGDSVVVSESEALELIRLLSELLASKKFLEISRFVQGISRSRIVDSDNLREIYLSVRKRNGRSRAMSSLHWAEFQHRLGRVMNPAWGARADRMTFSYFESMERKLFSAIGLRGRVLEHLMSILDAQRDDVERIRGGEIDLRTGAVREVLEKPLSLLNLGKVREIPSKKVAAAIVLVADTSVIFTTRDWGVAGTISAMASAASIIVH